MDSTKILSSSTVFIRNVIRHFSWAPNQRIRTISEGLCNTKDWSNDAENASLITAINYILNIYIQIEKLFLKATL